MSRRSNPVTVYLTDEEKSSLERWADDAEKTQSQLLREAVLEYLDHDRAARIEDEVRDISRKLDDVLGQLDSSSTHTHTTPSDSLSTARQMIRTLQRNYSEAIKADDVETVIENHAGIDERTIRKYKRLFRSRGLLFEHPGDRPLWTTETDLWGRWVKQYANLNGGVDAAEAVIEQYPARIWSTDDGYQIEIEREAKA